jgi:hypothetical protein
MAEMQVRFDIELQKEDGDDDYIHLIRNNHLTKVQLQQCNLFFNSLYWFVFGVED